MKLHLPAVALIVLSISVAACGGGGTSGSFPVPGSGTGGGPPVIAQTSPSPLASATITPTSPPIQAGDAFTYSGSITRTDIYSYPVTNPFPDGTVTAQVAQNATLSNVANPFGSGMVFDYKSAERDAYTLQTLQFTTDSFYAFTRSGATATICLLGSKMLDDQNNLVTTQYDKPQRMLNIPEAANQTWTNDPAAKIDTNYASGNTSDRQIASDGTYTEHDVFANTGSTTPQYPTVDVDAASHSDGSASVVFLFNEEGRKNFQFLSETFTFLMGPSQSSGITLKQSQFNVPVSGSPSPSPSPSVIGTAPQWFTKPLFTETDTDNGTVTIPSACNVPAQFGTQAFQVVRTIHNVDPAFGNVDDMTTTQYVLNSFGVVCAQITDVNNAFYDFAEAAFENQTNGNFFNFSQSAAQPLIATTINETLTLQSIATGVSAQRHSTSIRPISPAAVALAELAVQRETTLTRMKRLRMQIQRMQQALLRGGHTP